MRKEELKKIKKSILKVNKIPNLYEPVLDKKDENYLIKCIKSKFISSHGGKYLEEFKFRLKSITSSKFVIPVINATSGIYLVLRFLGVNKDQEVLVPAFTFIGSVNPISYVGASPHFVDINKNTLCVDFEKLIKYLHSICRVTRYGSINKLTKKKIKYLIFVHTYGQSEDIKKFSRILYRKFKIKIIEDCAEALGTYYNNKHVGNDGIFSVYSFNGNKIATTAGGGAIVTNNQHYAKKIQHLATTAKVKNTWKFKHDEIGFNFGMSNLIAALGCSQLKKLNKIIKIKRNMRYKYNEIFRLNHNFSIFKEQSKTKSNYWINLMILNNANFKDQFKIISYLNKNRIYTKRSWELISGLKPYNKLPRMDLSNSKEMLSRAILLPSTPTLE